MRFLFHHLHDRIFHACPVLRQRRCSIHPLEVNDDHVTSRLGLFQSKNTNIQFDCRLARLLLGIVRLHL